MTFFYARTKNLKKRNSEKRRGFTLIEMIIYTSILSAVFVLVVNTLLLISRSYRSIKLTNDINNSASLSLERLTREIRLAESVNAGSSILGAHPGSLVLNTTEEGSPATLNFFLEDDALKLSKDGLLSGLLTRDNIEVSNLVFKLSSGENSEMVKIEMTLTGSEKGMIKSDNFYTSAVLRGSY
ncbi:hypothetical protein COV42_00575 [Candidatus Campbellbacteria bacterium CG11_big_fil_rev_8_21_14_0_20_44_21]|uniref:Prepilin-type N-terminal cleavage/methylation domain-containing protein n=1 Tax=Candidatus Campbellbacteria bacterium CG22_combo_CG10-13_8_21_14_all_43_18 TaxID=1974530 RepID=A0A2H0DWE9_9BACT|nr:MAG: hypothetical protein COW82_01770 [Candidatus Campbellbacteria bacterium CG22_combo_CG10-13_8_21_14_all_43_18]PIR24459.1 MAG: hypothetical protein COV42_00575 [Candidatus Campbellbacteria bacterium CG11_big_fil_rev_8_21_14_0_20_44_21]